MLVLAQKSSIAQALIKDKPLLVILLQQHDRFALCIADTLADNRLFAH